MLYNFFLNSSQKQFAFFFQNIQTVFWVNHRTIWWVPESIYLGKPGWSVRMTSYLCLVLSLTHWHTTFY